MKANHAFVKKRLNLAKGQIEGILRMIDDDRYCIDISQQLLAAIALLKQANRLVLNAHLESCIRETTGAEVTEKIREILDIMERMNK